MGGLGRGSDIYKGCGYPYTDARQFVGGLGSRHTRVIYTGLSEIDLRCELQLDKLNKVWLLHMSR